LIDFKREFSFQTVQRLWEVLWTDYLSPNFNLFLALGILLVHKNRIVSKNLQFDEILKFTNDLSGKLDLERTLIQGEKYFLLFKKMTEGSEAQNLINENMEKREFQVKKKKNDNWED